MSRPKRTVAEVLPPGDLIREELNARGWTQRDLAEIVGRPIQAINAVVNAKKEVTPETAVALGAAFGTSPEFWLNLESAYRLSRVGPPDPTIEARARKRTQPLVARSLREHHCEPEPGRSSFGQNRGM
jgi:HTH-type transcriptional regulator/antitoxin HigA